MKKLIFVLAVFFVQALQAQQQELELARRYFERTYYSEAIPLYEKAAVENQTVEVVKNLADSYYYTNDLKNAERWYRFLIKNLGQNYDEEYYFRYIQTLKASGNYEEAKAIAEEFMNAQGDADSVSKFERDLEELENISGIGNRFEIKSLPVNTKYSEFGAIPQGDKLVFSGVKRNNVALKKTYKWNDELYLDLLTIPLTNLKSGDSTAATFSDAINTFMHEGNAVFTKDGKTIYFTRNNSKNGKKVRNDQKISNLKLYKAELVDGKWTNIVSLPFNSDAYSTEHPALSNDEKTLYFASDMPGSLGSFDIYSVAINDGLFETTKNLGSTINTSRKEQFPFVAKDNKLYFSSNGHFGYGSLDVFVSEMKNASYSRPLNVGLPVNSGYDDFSFFIDADTKEGYFASNRLDGKGSDDIYELKETKPLIIESCKQYIEGTITDADTKLPLNKASVTIQDGNKKQIEKTITTADGQFKFLVGCMQNYTVLAEKELYSKDSKVLALHKERNKINDASMALKSDLAVKKEHEIAQLEDKKKAEIIRKEKEKEILSKEKDVIRDKDRLIIKTDPIYFDYDLWYIRKESKIILNRVIALMNKYPGMVVEIGSHTDVRGNNAYNLDLSSKRANSTREYFLENGIPAARIFSKGYGETVNIIKCVPEDSCNEEQHELNRRSEFVIKGL